MTERTTIATDKAPRGRGPYPQAVKFGNFVFVSGQGPLDPATSVPIAGDFVAQVNRTFDNVEAILQAAGVSLVDVVKATIYLADLANVVEFNRIYEQRMPTPYPARTLVEAGLRGIAVEFDIIACTSGPAT
jgi:2-iminobutanoate/2-iminopropanoate deaminase